MLGRRLRRRPNINPASGQCIVFDGLCLYGDKTHSPSGGVNVRWSTITNVGTAPNQYIYRPVNTGG